MNEREIRAWGLYVAAMDSPSWRWRYQAGARVRPRKYRRRGTIVRVTRRDHAGAPSHVEVRWDAFKGRGEEWSIDFLVLVEDERTEP